MTNMSFRTFKPRSPIEKLLESANIQENALDKLIFFTTKGERYLERESVYAMVLQLYKGLDDDDKKEYTDFVSKEQYAGGRSGYSTNAVVTLPHISIVVPSLIAATYYHLHPKRKNLDESSDSPTNLVYTGLWCLAFVGSLIYWAKKNTEQKPKPIDTSPKRPNDYYATILNNINSTAENQQSGEYKHFPTRR